MSERAVPFHCPYCGEEDLRPAESSARGTSMGTERSERVPGAAWWCAGCLRTFVVTFVGIGVPETTRPPEKTGSSERTGP